MYKCMKTQLHRRNDLGRVSYISICKYKSSIARVLLVMVLPLFFSFVILYEGEEWAFL